MRAESQSAEIKDVLVGSHRRFLDFVERRVGDRSVAEDILQDAFVRGIGRAEQLREDESSVAWFYRILRNAVIDHYRRRAATERGLSSAAAEALATEVPDAVMHQAVCGCVSELASTLKPDYAAALQRVDIDGMAVKAFADEVGISANNAAVRLHRARGALRERVRKACGTCAEHGCLDCSCSR